MTDVVNLLLRESGAVTDTGDLADGGIAIEDVDYAIPVEVFLRVLDTVLVQVPT